MMTKIHRYATTWVKRALTSALAISALATGPACADLDAGDRGGARLEDENDDEWDGRSAPFDGGASEDFYAHDVSGGTPPQDDGADDEGLRWSIDAGVADPYNSYDVGGGAEDPNACPAACLGLPMWQELVLDPAAGPIDSCDYTEYGSTWSLEIVGEGGYATAHLDTNSGSGTCTSWTPMTGEQTVNLSFAQANACTGRMYSQIDALGPACGEDPPQCGNGILEAGEACDGADLNGASCGDQGWSGTLMCSPICTLNWGTCDIPPEPWCGDWVVEGTEQCDGGNLNGHSCGSLGVGEGNLGCTGSCAFDTSSCIGEDPNACPAACLGLPMWQELVLDPAAGPIDSCDYTEYGSTYSLEIVGEGGYATAYRDTNSGNGTCTSWSPMTGEQTVDLSYQQANSCTLRMYLQIDALGPACGEDPQCGNGILEAGEACDGADLNGASCGDQGWSGTLTCSPICTLNWGSCDIPPEPWCGDWVVQGTEQCDGGNLNGHSCGSLGLGEGNLGCTGSCAFDTSSCIGEDPSACPAACLGLSMWQELVLDPAAGPIDSCDYTEYGSTWSLEIVGEGGYATAHLDTNSGSGTCTSWTPMTGEQTVNLSFAQANACTGRMYSQIDALGPACGEDPQCGNGILEAGEACDGADLNGASCGDQGWSGTLTCSPICTLNWGTCDIPPEPWCGDWVVEGTEQCDAGNLNGHSCASLGLGEGNLGCTGSCAFDTSSCIGEDPNACPAACLGLSMWQELVLDPAAGPIDSCDYTEYGSTWSLEIVGEGGYATAFLDTAGSGTCTSWSPMTGEQTVNLTFQQANACTGRMYSQIDALGPACGEDPPQCGNGILEAGEACDGADLNGANCGDQGWSGTLTCSPICTLNWGSCDIPPEPWCGDWVVQGTEQCDGGNLNGQSCGSLGLGEGGLGCTGSCTFDTSWCIGEDPNACPAACLGLPMWQELVLDPAAGPIDSCDYTEYGSTWSLEIVGEGGYATAFLDTAGSGTCTSWSPMTGEQTVNLTFQQANACTGRMYQQIDALGPACGEDPPQCGNGILEAGEACDGADLNGASCGDQGWSGTLMCSPICTLNWGSCDIPPEPWCGDWVVEGTEQCDGGNLNGHSCGSLGLGEGNLGCTGSCAFDTSSCIGEDPNACPAACLGLPMWQELVLDPAAGPIDSCDYSEYGSTYSLEIVGEGGYATAYRDTNSGNGTCTSWSPMTGEQTVDLSYQQANSCTLRMYQQIDALGPACGEDPQCGNGILEAGEACDGADLNGASCGDQGWSGALTCSPICTLNWGTCDIPPEPWCGDWVVEGTEQCDAGNLNGHSCGSLGLGEGNLACTASCAFDTSSCIAVASCGNEVVEGSEQCDGSEFAGNDCGSLGFGYGMLACTASCTVETWGCVPLGWSGAGPGDPASCGNPGGGPLAWTNGTGIPGGFYCYEGDDSTEELAHKACESHYGSGNCCVITGGYQDQQYGSCASGGSTGSIHWHWDDHPEGHCEPNYVVGDVVAPGWCGTTVGNFLPAWEDPSACPAACLGLPMWQELVLDPAAGPIDSCDYTEYGSTWSLEIVGDEGYAAADLDTNSGSGTCTSWSPMTGEQTVELTFQQANACTGRMYSQIDALGPACGEDPPQCGNGILEAGEACDGAELNGASCGDQGWSGTLMCSPICTLNWGTCDIPPEPWCGDWVVEGTEQCDGGNLNGHSCGSLGLGEGNLGCTGSCAFDTSSCIAEDPNACPAACLGLPMWQELVLDPAAGPIDSCDYSEYGSTYSLEIVGEGGYATAHRDTNSGNGTCTSWSPMTGEQTVDLSYQQANSCTLRMYLQIDALGPSCAA